MQTALTLNINKPRRQKTYLRTSAPSEVSDWPVRSRSLIRIFTDRILDSQRWKVSSLGQRWLIWLHWWVFVGHCQEEFIALMWPFLDITQHKHEPGESISYKNAFALSEYSDQPLLSIGWSESLLCAWRHFGFLATHSALWGLIRLRERLAGRTFNLVGDAVPRLIYF